MSTAPVVPVQPFSNIVDISISIAAAGLQTATFNKGLILDESGVIDIATRLKPYNSLAEMVADGFATTSAAYKSASLYFGQPTPPQQVYIGAIDPSAMNTVVPAVSNPAAANYQVGDVLTVIGAVGNTGTVRVTAVSNGGVPTTYAVVSGGTAYELETATTTGGHGTNASVSITVIGESAAMAAAACRSASSDWYGFNLPGAVKQDHLDLAAFAQSAQPQCCYFGTTGDADVLAGTTGNVLLELQTLNYNRCFMMVSTDVAGTFPNNIYSAAAAMGRAMGLTTTTSNFTMKFKTLTGIAPDAFTTAQITSINTANGNTYTQFPGRAWVQQGVVSNGQFYDSVLGFDILGADMQIEVVEELVDDDTVPQTDSGENLLLARVNRACDAAVTRGFLAPSNSWNGAPILKLNTGDPVPLGYLSQAQSYQLQQEADRVKRLAMPIYVAACEAGSVHGVVIGVTVQL